jgi:hypothetical protein
MVEEVMKFTPDTPGDPSRASQPTAMNGPRMAPAELAPAVPDGSTVEQRIAMWVDLMNACDALVLAGLRREIGPDGDLKAAYRKWYAEQMEEHDRMIFHLAAELNRRGGGHG